MPSHNAIENLERYCSSDYLTLDGIKCAMEFFVSRDRLNGSDFFHRVCMNPKVTLDIVEYLVGLYPDAVENVASWGTYPLHMACLNEHCPNSAVKFLMNKNCDAIRLCSSEEYMWDKRGCERLIERGLPLHIYLSRTKNLDIDIVKDMVMQYPDSLMVGGDNGIKSNPIHVVFRNPNLGAMLDVVKYLVHSEPSLLQSGDSDGNLPLHLACCNASTTVEIVNYLVDSHPAATSQNDRYNSLPINLLCSNENDMPDDVSIAILNILLEVHRPGLLNPGISGSLPIHFAVSNMKRSLEFCRILLDANPLSVTHRDANDDLPFHYACSCGHLNTVKYLYELYPESIGITGYELEYPLNCACDNENLEVLKYVYELYPEAMKLKVLGQLPIHKTIYAEDASDEHKLKILQFITHCDPICVSQPNDSGDLPLHCACAELSISLIKYLYDLHPEAILERGSNGKLPIGIVRESLEEDREENEASPVEDIIAFLGIQQNYARTASNVELLTTPDDNGWLPLHHALHNNSPVGSIHLLVKGNPDTINVADNNGLLPLQIACKSCTVSVVKYFTNHIEDSFSLRDGNDNYLLHYACRGGNIEVVMYLLKSGHTRAVSEKNKDNMLPVHLFNQFVKERWCEGNDRKYVETIWHLLLADPETLQCSNWIQDEDTASERMH
eukprot:scaffold29178_cov63-Cyclotella_meneghiniana.AAC.5